MKQKHTKQKLFLMSLANCNNLNAFSVTSLLINQTTQYEFLKNSLFT